MDSVIIKIAEIIKKYSAVTKVILFGSRARGDNTPKSDYDIAINAPSIDISTKNLLLDEIEQVDTLHKMDIVFISSKTDNKLLENIQRDGKIIMDKFQIKLGNYEKAISRLHEAIDESKENNSMTVRDGVIWRFEFTTELAWKTIREYLLSLEVTDINNPRAVMKEAFNNDIVTKEDEWIQILRDRNLTSHIYDEDEADEIYERIVNEHISLFDDLLNVLKSK